MGEREEEEEGNGVGEGEEGDIEEEEGGREGEGARVETVGKLKKKSLQQSFKVLVSLPAILTLSGNSSSCFSSLVSFLGGGGGGL